MHFDKHELDGYQIHAIAKPVLEGGYVAGVAVTRAGLDDDLPRCVFVHDAVANGTRFDDAQSALRYAILLGQREVRAQAISAR